MTKYSIIIPCRDRLELLQKAIDSIPERNDIEIIVVDNSDTPIGNEKLKPRKLSILHYIISDSKKGAGHARNVGLNYINGDYTIFLDSDDYFMPKAFEAFDKYVDSYYDIVFFDSNSIRLSDQQPSTRHKRIHKQIMDYLQTHNEDQLRYQFVNPICKMFRSGFLKDGQFQFQEVKVSNDLMFSTITGHYAKTITADSAVVYMITEAPRGASLVKQRSAENQFIRFKVFVDHYLFMQSIGRKDLCFRMSSYVWKALFDFGPIWFFRYIKYAYIHNINVFKV